MTDEQYSYENAIREFVYIELPFDGDADGRNDLVRADIIRPRELDGVEKIPVIMDPSPYYSLYPRHGEMIEYAHPEDKWNSPLKQFTFFFDNYFVPRGYAVILLSTSGTSLSEGFCDIGGPKDVASANAVVDWLNGRAKGYLTRDRRTPDNEVKADWASGLVGAIGKSYDGSVPNGMAATGIDGLRTIVPISAISSQYDWYHPQGVLLNGDDADGAWWEPDNFAASLQSPAEGRLQRFNTKGGWQRLHDGSDKKHRSYNEFWAERDYRSHVDRYKASVFIVHGVNDLNVMMNQVGTYWKALGEYGVPRKIWLHQYAHDDPFDVRHDAWLTTLERWFDYWLKDIDNGIMDEPEASIEDPDGNWHEYPSWPVPGAVDHTFGVAGGEDARLGVLGALDALGGAGDEDASSAASASAGVVAASGVTAASASTGVAVDEASAGVAVAAAPVSADSDEPAHVAVIKGARIPELTRFAEFAKAHDDRLLYVGEPLERDWHISGTPHISLRVKASAPDTNLCASLIEYGEGNYVQVSEDIHALVELTEKRPPVGGYTDDDKASYVVCVPRKSHEMQNMVTRGWIATAHKDSFSEFTPTAVDEWYEIGFDLLPTDWTVRAGHRLALAIYNNSKRLAAVPLSDFTVDLDSVRLTVPFVAA
ncbi:X-prolyl-dipeptidyl aminopeptidase [Bifidobacterium myosotis]|uniref:X-prolyl-dipeptidyl aminopeptidase n=1 Tax=Bifidobacterium myosotis TaxID=1630166 RepID=A0A261FEZ6_9BIFI|nr:CocE/NonD family hydrolase [Bifidobacterium myosotis]OZG57595.1 X-prolyl-dipeptidyl aminopeptidase [Bifidobacterium myosotis]